MKITKKITVDVSRENRFEPIPAKQLDNGSRYLEIELQSDGEALTVPSGATVLVNARRDDGAARSFAGTVGTGGKITVPLTSWMLELDGMVRCDVSVVVGDEKLTSLAFWVRAQRAANGNDEVSADENYDVLVGLINKCNAALVDAPYIGDNGNWYTGGTDSGKPSRGIQGPKGDPYGDDYVLEQGTSGIWYYRKWASGRAECWGTVECTGVTATNTWGNAYESTTEYGNVDYPFTFAELPVQQLHVGDSGAAFFVETQLNAQRHTVSNTGKWYFWRPAEMSSAVNVNVDVYVMGKLTNDAQLSLTDGTEVSY